MTAPVNPNSLSFGAFPLPTNCTQFNIWAPNHQKPGIYLIDQTRVVPMHPCQNGMHTVEIEDVGAGSRYMIRYAAGETPIDRPDPASRFQPDGVHGASMVIDANHYPWTDANWQGVPKEDLIIYELHIGAFTETGTYQSAIDRLDELVDLGITAIELMPLADCAGRWNWGYDGVNLFAPNRNFGNPDDLRALVDAAHAKGLSVILDVVYNHLGPEGNYLADSGPYLSDRHSTAWGDAPNFDDPEHGSQVRQFVIANAIYWLEAFHFDGLRVDAIHCMKDEQDPHIAVELSEAVRSWSEASGRPALLIAETNVYDPNMLDPVSSGGVGFDAEWCDDFLHSVFAVLRPGERLSSRTYEPGSDLDQALEHGYVYDATIRTPRQRRKLNERVDTTGLIYSIQHHDFIGNHPLGKRLHQLTSIQTQRAAVTLLLLSPGIPMLFMGEEFASEHPFRFFVDFGDEALRKAVVDGRQREYPQHDWRDGVLPTDPQAFYQSKIGPIADGNTELRNWYQRLIGLRKQWRACGLLSDDHLRVVNDPAAGLYTMRYTDSKSTVTVAVRLSDNPQDAGSCILEDYGELLLDSHPGGTEILELRGHQAKVFIQPAS